MPGFDEKITLYNVQDKIDVEAIRNTESFNDREHVWERVE